MSMFYCEEHQRQEDSDEVGFVDRGDGTAACQESQESADDDFIMRSLSPRDQRYEIGGEYGGDGPDD